MGKLVSPKPKKNRLEEDGPQTAPRYECGQNFEFSREEGLCLARTHRCNFMKDDQRLSVEVEFIRQTSFLRTALRSWLLARVSHPIAATRIADLYINSRNYFKRHSGQAGDS